jgi:hypothetical protein
VGSMQLVVWGGGVAAFHPSVLSLTGPRWGGHCPSVCLQLDTFQKALLDVMRAPVCGKAAPSGSDAPGALRMDSGTSAKRQTTGAWEEPQKAAPKSSDLERS